MTGPNPGTPLDPTVKDAASAKQASTRQSTTRTDESSTRNGVPGRSNVSVNAPVATRPGPGPEASIQASVTESSESSDSSDSSDSEEPMKSTTKQNATGSSTPGANASVPTEPSSSAKLRGSDSDPLGDGAEPSETASLDSLSSHSQAGQQGNQPTHASHGSHLYVYDIDTSVEESLLQAAVGPMAAALGCVITTVRVCRDPMRQKHLGYAYINFAGTDDAARIADALEPFFVNNSLTRLIPFQDRSKFVRPPRPPPIQTIPDGVFIKNIHPAATARDIYDAFLPFGPISWCRVAVNEYGQSRGFAYVTYASAAAPTSTAPTTSSTSPSTTPADAPESAEPEKTSARKAIEAMNNTELFGMRLFVGQNLPKRSLLGRYDDESASGEFRNLFVRGINMTVTEQVFYDLFANIGEVETYSMPLDDYFNHRGYGFVRYKDPQDAQKAIAELNGIDVEGRTLQVTRAQQRNSNYARNHHQHHHHQNQNAIPTQNMGPAPGQGQGPGAMIPGAIPGTVPVAAPGYPQSPYSMYNTFSPYLPYSPAALSSQGSTPQASPGPYRRHSLYPPLSGRSSSIGPDRVGGDRQNTPPNRHYDSASPRANLYIQRFGPSVTDTMLASEFGRFGPVVSAKVMMDDFGESRGFGFVCFENNADAERAIAEMNGKNMWGGILYVAHALRKDKQKYPRHNGNGGLQKRPPRALSIPTPAASDLAGATSSAGSGGRVPPYYYLPVPYPAYYTAAAAAAASAADGMTPYVPANMKRLTPNQLGYGTSLAAAVASAENEEAEKQVIGEALYPKVLQHTSVHGDDELASQITGILLNQSQTDLLQWVDTDSVLSRRIQQAVDAYQDYASRAQ